MKKAFNWYFPLSSTQIRKIWSEAVLTVDTNVLLDLYRYHQDTRQAILDSLKSFKNRAWISHQVADEFFKNRNNVILSSVTSFNDADRSLNDIKKVSEEPLKKLKGNRIIPDALAEELEKTINTAISSAEAKLNSIRAQNPNYRENDPILKEICELFDSSIGSSFDKELLSEVLKEGKRRSEKKIPPGFKDLDKDGDRPYGDYIIWRQILDYIKETQKPLILVTSEEKEDWWEKASGKIVGPQYELRKEFFEETQQTFLMYRTDRFLAFASESSGRTTNTAAVAEILDVAKQRQGQRETPLAKIIEQKQVINDGNTASGEIAVNLLEPTYMFTCSGRVEPQLNDIPSLTIRLTESPNGTPVHIIRAGTGTTFDFNIHLKSMELGVRFPVGRYTFEYFASIQTYSNIRKH
ncbi:PIN domain-containing protein [Terrimonas ferruginea]|uniref:PIN domain-containing protein n=1 Tax=Terrimonas ferruginea TaxID=249 RepID=UPI00049154CB|nr:PIN domain-containing protein [Terrimonas ferruginea]